MGATFDAVSKMDRYSKILENSPRTSATPAFSRFMRILFLPVLLIIGSTRLQAESKLTAHLDFSRITASEAIAFLEATQGSAADEAVVH